MTNSNSKIICADDYKRGLSRHYSENRNQSPAAIQNYSIVFLNSWFSCLKIAGFNCHAIENKQTKPFISFKSRTWEIKVGEYAKTLAQIQVDLIFPFARYSKKRFSFVWRRHVVVPLRGTNMEARNQKKYLLPSFALKA